jgi:hypothetical protein
MFKPNLILAAIRASLMRIPSQHALLDLIAPKQTLDMIAAELGNAGLRSEISLIAGTSCGVPLVASDRREQRTRRNNNGEIGFKIVLR